MSRLIATLLCALFVSTLIPLSNAEAGSLTFTVRSAYQYKVSLEFYSQSRNAAWPGGNKIYRLYDSSFHTFKLNCRSGEKICLGAWVRGNRKKYWALVKTTGVAAKDVVIPVEEEPLLVKFFDDLNRVKVAVETEAQKLW